MPARVSVLPNVIRKTPVRRLQHVNNPRPYITWNVSFGAVVGTSMVADPVSAVASMQRAVSIIRSASVTATAIFVGDSFSKFVSAAVAALPTTVKQVNKIIFQNISTGNPTMLAPIAGVASITKAVTHTVTTATAAAVGTLPKQVNKILFFDGGGHTQGMNAAVGVVASFGAGTRTVAKQLLSTVGLVYPTTVSPLLPIYAPKIQTAVTHTIPTVTVAVVASLPKRAGRVLTTAAIAVSPTVVKSALKRLVLTVPSVASIVTGSVHTTQLALNAAVASLGSVVKQAQKSFIARPNAVVAILSPIKNAGVSFPKEMDALVAVVPSLFKSGLKLLATIAQVSVSAPTITREVDKQLNAAVADVAALLHNQLGVIFSATVATVGTVSTPARHVVTESASVAVSAIAPIAVKAGVLTTQAVSAAVAVASPILRKSVLKPLSSTIAVTVTLFRKQVLLHLLPLVAVVGSFTNRTSKRITVAVAVVGLPPIARFGLHFNQALSATVRLVGHLRECFQLTSHIHHPGSPLSLTPEDPDTTLTTHPHDSGCQGD